MAARSIAKGTVTFGLVSIPVRFYSTNEPSSGISFNLLHETCHTRLKQQYVCPKDHEIVSRDQMVKGYQFAKDQYVVFEPEELKALEAASTQAIEITEFVPAEAVDPLFYDTSYYLAPDKGGERAYRLLGESMKETGLLAVATYAARGKQILALVRPLDDGLVLQQLRWHDEVKSADEVPVPEVELRKGELDLAMQFVRHLATDSFDPTKYTDEVKGRVQALVQSKIEGKEIAVQPEAPQAQIIDLMEALRASLKQGPRSATRGDEPPRKAPRSKARRAPERAKAPAAKKKKKTAEK